MSIYEKFGKNLWGMEGAIRPYPMGGAPVKPFAATVYGLFAVREKLRFYFDYRYNLSGVFYV